MDKEESVQSHMDAVIRLIDAIQALENLSADDLFPANTYTSERDSSIRLVISHLHFAVRLHSEAGAKLMQTGGHHA